MSEPTIADRVGQYIQLRDEIKRLNDLHKEKMAPYNDTLEQLNGVLLAALQAQGGESLRTPNGTVYTTRKASASVKDGKEFMDYVISNNLWDLLDRKANKTAVEDFIKEHNSPPPGVNYTTVDVVGVRRS